MKYANDQVGLFGNHPRVWHPLRGQTVGTRKTYCGRWPDTFAKYAAARDALPMCGQCARQVER